MPDALPAGERGQQEVSATEERDLPTAPVVVSAAEPASLPAPSDSEARSEDARRVGKRLAQAGYERIKVGSKNGVLWVRWENNLYNRDERDSLFHVADMVRATATDHRIVRLQLLNQGIAVTERTLYLDAEPGAPTLSAQYPQSDWWNFGEHLPEWDYQASYGPSWKPRLSFSPTTPVCH